MKFQSKECGAWDRGWAKTSNRVGVCLRETPEYGLWAEAGSPVVVLWRHYSLETLQPCNKRRAAEVRLKLGMGGMDK